MAIRLYGVLDADGTKVNTITADDVAVADGWYPGYGAALIDEGENPPDPPKEQPKGKPETWAVLPALAEPMVTGDKYDFKTGEVIKRTEPVGDVLAEDIALDVKP